MRPCSMETEAREGKPTTSPTAIDVLDLGLEVLVDGDAAAVVGFNAGGGEIEVVDGALAADGVEQGVAGDLFLAFKIGDDGAVGEFFDAFHFFAEAHGDAAVAQVVAEGLDDFLVGKFEQLGSRFSIRVTRTPRMANMQVYSTPMTPPPTTIRDSGQGGEFEDLVAVDDGAAVDGNLGRRGRLGADGDDDAVGFEVVSPWAPSTRTWLRIDEVGDAVDDVDAVAGELGFGDVHFSLDDRLDAKGKVGHGDLFFDPVIHAVDRAVVVAGEMQHGLAHGLGGDGAGVDADSADDGACLDHGYALLHFGSGHGGALARRPGADNDQVVFGGTHAIVSRVLFGYGA